jgi:hypothetical protein
MESWLKQETNIDNEVIYVYASSISTKYGRHQDRTSRLGGRTTPPAGFSEGPIIAMAFVGFFLSRYLAAYQLGHIPYPSDPFFGDGTRRVLESEVSKPGRSPMPAWAPCPTCSRRSRA